MVMLPRPRQPQEGAVRWIVPPSGAARHDCGLPADDVIACLAALPPAAPSLAATAAEDLAAHDQPAEETP